MRRFLKLFLLPFAFLCVAIIRLLDKCGVLIRIGELWSERIGHLAGNSECYLCEKDGGLHPKSFDIWYHRRTPANKHLARMFSRVIWVDPTKFVKLVMICNMLFKGWEKHMAHSEQIDRDIHNLQEKHSPHLKFTLEEEMECRETMKSWGIPEGAKWVCLIVRDKAYLPTMHHHDYRDSDISTYEAAAYELAYRGYYVVRMGAQVLKRFEARYDPYIIDYATNGMRSELMDLYLGAKCEFCISNGTGFDAIPVIFRRPVVFVNYVPLQYLNTWINSLAIWKHHYRHGKRMGLGEIYDIAGLFMATQQFEQAGITLVDNTPEEIKDVVVEMDRRLIYKNVYDREENEMQEKFWKQFPRSMSPYNGKPLHGEIRMRIGSEFLEKYVSATADSPS